VVVGEVREVDAVEGVGVGIIWIGMKVELEMVC
jgi:hypothetical protein